MKYLVALMLFAAFAFDSGYGQDNRATRSTTKSQGPVRTTLKRITTRSAPVRQQVPTRPVPTRGTVQTTPRRQNPPAAPPQPTRGNPQQPPQPTRAPPPQPTRAPPPNPQQPNPNPIPTLPIVLPTAPSATQIPPRFSTRSPLVGNIGIRDSRCPMTQDIRKPVQLPHSTNCERFFKCESGLAFEFQCPVGQHWNVAQNYCDFPNNARCGSNNWGNQPNWNQPNQPNWNQPNQPNWNQPNQPNWNQPNQPNWNNNPVPQVPQVPDFQHPIDIPLARGK